MDVRDYTITDSFVGALSTICKHCTGRSCYTCEIFELRLTSGLCSPVSKSDRTLEDSNILSIPDTFSFQTKINCLTGKDIYYAQREDDHYTVTLPSVGCVYRLSVEHVHKQIVGKKYMIVPTTE